MNKLASRCLHVVKNVKNASAQPRYDQQPKFTLGEIREIIEMKYETDESSIKSTNTNLLQKTSQEKFTLGRILDVLESKKSESQKSELSLTTSSKDPRKLTLRQISNLRKQNGGSIPKVDQPKLTFEQVRDRSIGENTRPVKKPKTTLNEAKFTFGRILDVLECRKNESLKSELSLTTSSKDPRKLTLRQISNLGKQNGGSIPKVDQPKLTFEQVRDRSIGENTRPVKKPKTTLNEAKFTFGRILDVLECRKNESLKSELSLTTSSKDPRKLTLRQISNLGKQNGGSIPKVDQPKLTFEQVRDRSIGENTRSVKKPKTTLNEAKLTFNQVASRNLSGSPLNYGIQPNMTLGQPSKMTFGEFREIAAENWERRCELATAYRSLAKYNMHEGVCNHLTVKAPSVNADGSVMITAPYGLYWTEVTPESLVAIDMESGELVEGQQSPEITAQSIHMGIYQQRPDINCIMHTHAVYSSILGALKDPCIKMLHQTSTRFLENVTYDQDFPLMANQNSNQEGERLGKILGNKEVLLMGHHGLATVGKTVPIAFDLHYYFEKAAEIQVMAYQCGQPLKFLPDDVVTATHAQMVDCQLDTSNAHFYALQETLKREDPTFMSKR